jgi:hypothetical protein
MPRQKLAPFSIMLSEQEAEHLIDLLRAAGHFQDLIFAQHIGDNLDAQVMYQFQGLVDPNEEQQDEEDTSTEA